MNDETRGGKSSQGRALGLDPGTRRTGIALSDASGQLATPLETVELPLRDLIAHVCRLVERHGVRVVVIGHPRLPSGDTGPVAALAEKLAAGIEAHSPATVVLWDEALTSWEADRLLTDRGLRDRPPTGRGSRRRRAQRKAAVDRLAAALILQDYLDSRTRGGGARGEA